LGKGRRLTYYVTPEKLGRANLKHPSEMTDPPNNGLQRTALVAAAEAGR
jgi:hypothetical protein